MTDLLRPLALTVFGVGYLGAAHAACLAELGFDVLGVDTDPQRVEALAAGRLPFFEPGLEPLLRSHVASGRLRFTTSYQEAAAFGDVHFLCVGTPQLPGANGADLRQLNSCVAALAPLLRGSCLVVGKSTVPVGTAIGLTAEFTRLSPVGHLVDLAWNPEFLREGHAVEDTLRPDRIVAGVRSTLAEATLRTIYARPLSEGVSFFTTDLATAELAKVAANSFLATKIAFINAMAEVCEVAAADVTHLSEILGADPRIGVEFLRPGLGFGGACLPKDIRAFMARAAEIGAGESVGFLREVDAINHRCRTRVVALAEEIANRPLAECTVGVLGLAFKPDSDDIRDSPALEVARAVHALGARVTAYDPVAVDKARRLYPELEYAGSTLAAVTDADVVLLLTEWAEFREADPEVLGKAVAHRKIVDGRHALDPQVWHQAGWAYRAFGRPAEGFSLSRGGAVAPSLSVNQI
jgi:UDPglucose 6-dehydrogenase